MRVAVAGGTGVVGRHVVTLLEQAGHSAIVLARSRGVDLTTGEGLDAGLVGVDVVVDVSNVNTVSRKKSVAFFGTATSNLLAAEARAGLGHHVVLSIVNSDKVDFGYYEGKRRQEALVMDSPLPSTVLRTTQFHEFAKLFALRPGMVTFVPRMKIQPVAATEVAAALVSIAEAAPVGRVPDLAGPEVHLLPDLARQVLRARGLQRPVVPIPMLGRAGRQMRSGHLLPDASAQLGEQTFEDWLATQ